MPYSQSMQRPAAGDVVRLVKWQEVARLLGWNGYGIVGKVRLDDDKAGEDVISVQYKNGRGTVTNTLASEYQLISRLGETAPSWKKWFN